MINQQQRLLSEEEIIQKIIHGELVLFEILIRRYNEVLYKIARSFGFNHQDAEDIMQDVHVAAYTALKDFEGRSSYKTWISKIMVNKCLYKINHGYYTKEIPAGEIMETVNPIHAGSSAGDPADSFVNNELAMILEKSLQKIPVIYRTVFVLRQVQEYSVAETAEILDISPVNVKVRLNRAKALLQKELEQVYSRAEIFSFNLVYCDSIVRKVFEKISQ
jgi:RNA polymerase sigma-70 factor (ECF subfamily)